MRSQSHHFFKKVGLNNMIRDFFIAEIFAEKEIVDYYIFRFL